MTASFVPRGQAVSGQPLDIYGDRICVKLGGKETGGRYAFLEDVTPPGGGSPLHVHHREDEGFYVLDGYYLFEAGDEKFEARTGDFVLLPRDVPHRFTNIGSAEGTMMLTVEPAGIENFFGELSAMQGPPDPEKIIPVFAKYGLELLGPPRAFEAAAGA